MKLKNSIPTAAVLLAFAAFAAFADGAQAQTFDSDTASANATAAIVVPISITKTADLRFADVVASGTAGTVQMTAGSVRTSGGGALLGNGSGAGAASFTVGGDPDATYAITLPSTIQIAAGAEEMTVNGFTSAPATGTLTGGTQVLNVGATLQVGIAQEQGSYTGTFDVIVAYN